MGDLRDALRRRQPRATEFLDRLAAQSEKRSKPPLGIKPQYMWLQKREEKLYRAIARCNRAGVEPPEIWATWLNEVRGHLKETDGYDRE